MRFTEYVARLVRLAARYEEETYGTTQLNFSSTAFSPGSPPQLGSGMLFSDDAAGVRELSANASRIEGWRKTNTYQYCLQVSWITLLRMMFCIQWIQDFARYRETCAIRDFDVVHQLSRLRLSKNVPDVEMEAITRAISENLMSYEQMIEVSGVSWLSVIQSLHDAPVTASGALVSPWWRAFVSELRVVPPAGIDSRSDR